MERTLTWLNRCFCKNVVEFNFCAQTCVFVPTKTSSKRNFSISSNYAFKETQVQSPSQTKQQKKKAAVLKQFNSASKQLFGPLLENYRVSRRNAVAKDNTKIVDEDILCRPSNDQKQLQRESAVENNVVKTEKKYSLESNVKENSSRNNGTSMFDTRRQYSVQIPSEIIRVSRSVLPPTSKSCPSVSKILKETMSEQSKIVLERWKQKMIAKLGEDGFVAYQKELFRQGHVLHSNIENLMSEIHICSKYGDLNINAVLETIDIDSATEGYWKSLTDVFTNFCDVVALESHVQHADLNYLGIIDCIARYKNTMVLVDWKTSQRRKPYIGNTYDNPLQLAAYIGAVNHDKNYDIQIKDAVLVIAYEDGDPADVHLMTTNMCQFYWREWLKRLQLFNDRQKRPENNT